MQRQTQWWWAATVSGLIIALRGEVGKRIGGRGHVLE
jgi:hypothetical protein